MEERSSLSPMTDTEDWFQKQANSFDSAAEVYERSRPGYPADAVDWLMASAPSTVLDLGAGTGKFTRVIADRVETIIAVDPSERMLDQLSRAVPTADTRVGTGEKLPADESSVDAVFAAQAWHWMDPTTTVPEVARVLKDKGTLGLLWNLRDDRIDWVARMSEIIHDGPSSDLSDNPPEQPEGFTAFEVYETVWTQDLDRDEIAELTSSRSHFIVQDEPTRAQILRDLRALLDTHPDTRDLVRIPMPYRTLAYRTELRPVP